MNAKELSRGHRGLILFQEENEVCILKQEKAKKDVFLMAFLIVLSLVLLLWVIPSQIKVTAMMESESFTPRTWPYLITLSLLAVSLIGFINSLTRYLRLRREEGPAEKRKWTRADWEKELFPYLIFALVVLYGALFNLFGIIPATAIVPPILLWFLRCRKWQMYAVFYGFAAAIYLLFTRILLVPIR